MVAREAARLEHERRRWLRPDWKRHLRPDWERYVQPAHRGVMGHEFEARKAAFEPSRERAARLRGAEAALERKGCEREWQAACAAQKFRSDLAWERFKLAMLQLHQKAGFDPDQPRDDHGRWVNIGSGTSGDGVGAIGDSPPGIVDTLPDDPTAAITLVAENDSSAGRPIDLEEERLLGGHAIEGHVGKSPESLLARVRDIAAGAVEHGDFFEGLRVGSFPSLEAANKLVNSTITRNPDKVDLVTSGASPREELDARFSSPTGYEAYARNERSQAYLRSTDGVRVVIVPDAGAAKGYRIDTAFPRNFDR